MLVISKFLLVFNINFNTLCPQQVSTMLKRIVLKLDIKEHIR